MKATKGNIKAQIIKMSGNLAAVARSLGKSRQWLYNYLDKHPDLWETITETRETMLDNVESKLYQKALAGDNTCMLFYLRTQGKKRGYVERSEITGAEGESIQINVTIPDDDI